MLSLQLAAYQLCWLPKYADIMLNYIYIYIYIYCFKNITSYGLKSECRSNRNEWELATDSNISAFCGTWIMLEPFGSSHGRPCRGIVPWGGHQRWRAWNFSDPRRGWNMVKQPFSILFSFFRGEIDVYYNGLIDVLWFWCLVILILMSHCYAFDILWYFLVRSNGEVCWSPGTNYGRWRPGWQGAHPKPSKNYGLARGKSWVFAQRHSLKIRMSLLKQPRFVFDHFDLLISSENTSRVSSCFFWTLLPTGWHSSPSKKNVRSPSGMERVPCGLYFEPTNLERTNLNQPWCERKCCWWTCLRTCQVCELNQPCLPSLHVLEASTRRSMECWFLSA